MKIKFNFKDLFVKKNNIKIIMLVAFFGIFLIAISEFIPNKEELEIVEIIETKEDYAEYLEEKITNLVIAITGESSPEVMVTIQNSSEFVYATETSESIDENQKESEEKYIIIENSDGDQQAILLTEIEPKINGVVIATEYEGNMIIKESIINAVKTVLNLSSNQVYVVGKAN